jgi:hypothetical protein
LEKVIPRFRNQLPKFLFFATDMPLIPISGSCYVRADGDLVVRKFGQHSSADIARNLGLNVVNDGSVSMRPTDTTTTDGWTIKGQRCVRIDARIPVHRRPVKFDVHRACSLGEVGMRALMKPYQQFRGAFRARAIKDRFGVLEQGDKARVLTLFLRDFR